jgi:hypothetical protein
VLHTFRGTASYRETILQIQSSRPHPSRRDSTFRG